MWTVPDVNRYRKQSGSVCRRFGNLRNPRQSADPQGSATALWDVYNRRRFKIWIKEYRSEMGVGVEWGRTEVVGVARTQGAKGKGEEGGIDVASKVKNNDTIRLKNKGILMSLFRHEGWDKICFWEDGSWSDVGSGYGGEQDENNPAFCLSRRSFYDTTEKQRRLMVKAIEIAINEGMSPTYVYENVLGGEF
jgi:hypothetical protein